MFPSGRTSIDFDATAHVSTNASWLTLLRIVIGAHNPEVKKLFLVLTTTTTSYNGHVLNRPMRNVHGNPRYRKDGVGLVLPLGPKIFFHSLAW